MRKPSICFANLKLYHLLTREIDSQGMGGAELQVLLIAKELVRRGYDVSFVTYAHDKRELQDDIPFRLIQTFRRGSGLPFLKFFHPTVSSILRGLWKADADIYYCNVTGFLISLVVIVARLRGRKAVFCGASDTNFQPERSRMTSAKGRRLYLWGLKHCDAYITQNSIQQDLLRENFGKTGTPVPYGFPPPDGVSHRKGPVLWVGSIRAVKDPRKFIELARRLPSERFVMIGGPMLGKGEEPEEFYEQIAAEAAKVPNLEFKGFLPMEEADSYFNQASLFVNTSVVEGFPNTFLQAWSRGVPVITFVNPDNLIPAHGLGVVAQSLDEMVDVVARAAGNPSLFPVDHIRKFFDRHLTIASAVDKYEQVFAGLVDGTEPTFRPRPDRSSS
ncbi:MAG: glycosyltransferase family 4 protein [Ignavibacteria bacterium]|nr:glycosyltransferase family 4 protein [Ignavibacteria bacterium]